MNLKKVLALFCIAFVLSSNIVFASENAVGLPFSLKKISSAINYNEYRNEISVVFESDVTPTGTECLFICIFDNNFRTLQKVIIVPIEEIASGINKISVIPDFHDEGKAHKLKAFVWNSSNLCPLSNVVTCDFPSQQHADGGNNGGNTSVAVGP